MLSVAPAAAGRPIVIFPQGTRVAPGARRPYQPGVAALYRALALPLVPAALNSGRFWGRRAFIKRPGRIVLEFLEPIPAGRRRGPLMAELERRIETATAALEAVYPDQPVLLTAIPGTLPATALFERRLGVKTLFFSFSTADEKLHAPNEYLRIRRLKEGMRAWEHLWRLLATRLTPT